uniref:Uncharacterized protein n=1 Tax=Ditylenchus dipsaci TaxID=166011 RepID=A0A915D6K1_9BILA
MKKTRMLPRVIMDPIRTQESRTRQILRANSQWKTRKHLRRKLKTTLWQQCPKDLIAVKKKRAMGLKMLIGINQRSFQSDDDLSAVEDYDKRKKREVDEDSGSSFSSSESDFQNFSSEE